MNHLRDSSSPYLLQHADNPVDWYPWSDEALNKAKVEDKPIILSIGYSSCHWCHVMAHESFEDEEIAGIMNSYYINIKVDREERPDVDQIYMEAIQAMGLNGGWPLNVFLTPDQKPFYGGTYFPKQGWKGLLLNVVDAFNQHRDKLNESAEKFTDALNIKDSEKYQLEYKTDFSKKLADQSFELLRQRFDPVWGGMDKAPKFPMPSIWNYLMYYFYISQNRESKEHVVFTLNMIGKGGIYDHIGGGFARYSVDNEWHVPHFEKMLYDNGQLLSTYALAYKLSPTPFYRQILEDTASWIDREMTDTNGGFYSALDADSEGEEGKFYVWDKTEIAELAGHHTEMICEYYDVTENGNWEGKNVLRKLNEDHEIASTYEITIDELQEIVQDFRKKALKRRNSRIHPGLDNKILSGWNALTLKGLVDAYPIIKSDRLLGQIEKNYSFITTSLIKNDQLKHQYGSEIEGFADDYAAVIQSFIAYYQLSSSEKAIEYSKILTDRMFTHFYDEEENRFYYTSDQSGGLIARKKELFDNVIPSSNAIMAENLIKLGKILSYDPYIQKGTSMVNTMSHLIAKEPEYLSQWGIAGILSFAQIPEVAIVSTHDRTLHHKFLDHFLPTSLFFLKNEKSTLPILQDKFEITKKPTYYVCFNKTCKKPTHDFEEALNQINSDNPV